MIKQKPQGGHSDLAPSSKDWDPSSTGHDEDYRPEKDLWAQTHPEEGKPRPTRDPGKQESDENRPHSRADDVRRPDPKSKGEKLDEALQESFPASDPPAPAQPHATGWDLDETAEGADGKR